MVKWRLRLGRTRLPSAAQGVWDIAVWRGLGRGKRGGTGQRSAPLEKPSPGWAVRGVGEQRPPLARSLTHGGG